MMKRAFLITKFLRKKLLKFRFFIFDEKTLRKISFCFIRFLFLKTFIDYIVEYAGFRFQKNKSYFAATYVEPARPEPTPAAGESAPVAARVSPEAPLPDEPPLSGPIPANDPALVAGQKKVGNLTDSIRVLNDQIRSSQDELDRKSARSSGGDAASAQDIKKSVRAIQRLKEKRDELSGQLTEMGKP